MSSNGWNTAGPARGGQQASYKAGFGVGPRLSREQLRAWIRELREAGERAQALAAQLLTIKPETPAPFTMQIEVDDPEFIYGAERVETPGAGRDVVHLLRYDLATRAVTVLLDLP